MLGAAPGTPQYSGNYVPTIFSDLLLVSLYESTCLNEVANSNWTGTLRKGGDTVIIRTRPKVTIRDRAKNGKVIIENLESPPITLSIDYEKYFAFIIDRVDEFQSDINLQTEFADEASKDMNIYIEKHVFSEVYADVHADNAGLTAGKGTDNINLGATGTPLAFTSSNVYNKTVDCNTVLTKQFADKTGRWIAVPPDMAGMYQKSELKDANVYKDGAPIAKNGWMGKMPLSGMDVYQVDTLTWVPDGSYTCCHILFGQKEGLTFASQFNETDTDTKSPEIRGTVARGFNDYGFKVVKPELVGDLYGYFVNE